MGALFLSDVSVIGHHGRSFAVVLKVDIESRDECSTLFYSTDDESILRWIGLVKHPQLMSCIYITLFLVTMLIISQQVVTLCVL